MHTNVSESLILLCCINWIGQDGIRRWQDLFPFIYYIFVCRSYCFWQ